MRSLAAAAAAAILLLATWPAGAAARSPEDFGPFTVRTTHVRVPMPPDPRGPEGALPSVDADLYVPPAAGARPLVHLGHAWPGTLREFPMSGWATRLASRGFTVIVQDRRGGSNLAVRPELGQAADVVDLSSDVQSEDVLRVIRWALEQDGIAGSPLHGAIDERRIAIGGHSLGAYIATFAAVKAQTQGPALSALLLLDPSDERLGPLTRDSSLAQTPLLRLPTIVLASEENQHPVQCNMDDGPDCTLVAPQQYAALSEATPKLGLKVVGSVHEDVEDPSTIGTPESIAHLRTYQRYGMAWIELWAGGDCSVAPWLGGGRARAEERAGTIATYPGPTPVRPC